MGTVEEYTCDSEHHVREEWFQRTERWLYHRRQWAAEVMAWLAEQEELTREPSVGVAKYSLAPVFGGFEVSSTEWYAIQNADRENNMPVQLREKAKRVRQLDYAIQALGQQERELVRLKYDEHLENIEVWCELRLSRSVYYEMRRQIVETVAQILGFRTNSGLIPDSKA